MGTNTGTIMTLANSIIGVSVLAMPFCFKQCGIALSIVMLLSSSLVSRLACHFLLKAAIMARRRNFEFLAFHTFGSTGKFTAELFIIGFLMGTCIAFFVVVGDLGPAIVAKALGINNTAALRPSVLIGLAAFVVLPLGLLRNVDSLASVCTATIGFYVCLVVKVMGEALPHLLAGDWLDQVHLWRPAGIMQCIPIFSMALFCQTQLFEIYESMHNASLERMNDVIRAAVNMCTGVYIFVGFFGYVAYCTQTFSGNVMMSFTPSMVSEMIKMGFVLSVAVSFPLVIFPCRASLYSLLFRRIGVPHHEGTGGHIPEARFKCLTVFIISVALVVGLLIPNIELVLGLVGSTIGVLICVMFPAAAFICISSKSSSERLLAQVVLFIGALILVLGTYATLYAANEINPQTEVTSIQPELDKAPRLPDKVVIDLPLKLAQDEQKAEPNVKMKEKTFELKEKPLPADTDVKAPLKDEKPDKAAADVRQEPPVPVEPGASQVVVQSAMPAVVAVEEQQVQEPEKEEEVNLVDQDAIKKEDEELAEAEKQAKDESEKKDAELLRKLEEHEEEQMKLLREQKQILQALQEHKKEIDQKKMDLSFNRTAQREKQAQKQIIAKPQKEIDEQRLGGKVENQGENEVVRPQKQIIEQKNIAKPQIEIDEQRLGGKVKNQGENEVVRPQKQIIAKPQKEIDEQRLGGKVKNQGENEVVKPQKQILELSNIAIKVVEQLRLGGNVENQQEKEVVYQERLSKPSPPPNLAQQPVPTIQYNVDYAVVPQQSNFLLERLKSPPLPLTVQKKPPPPADTAAAVQVQEKVQDTGGDAKAMHREILQEPSANNSMSNNNKRLQKKLHDREKRDIEEENNINTGTFHQLPIRSDPVSSREETIDPNLENCAVTEKASGAKEVGNQIDDIAKQGNIVANSKGEVNSKSKPIIAEPSASSSSLDLVEVNTSQVVNVASLIKTAIHLTQPEVRSVALLSLQGSVRQGALQQDAKPMKRDLKSLADEHDKTDDD